MYRHKKIRDFLKKNTFYGEPTSLCKVIYRQIRGIFFAIVLLLLMSSPAFSESCYALNPPKMVFSNFNPVANQSEDISTTIDFHCAPAFKGKKFSAVIFVQTTDRGSEFVMKNLNGDIMRFGIFSDPARSIPLSIGSTVPIRDINPDSKTFQVVIYGRIFSNQANIGIGNYRSSISLLVNY